ncbi:MAG: PQQ-binding-like beta-propeller repeat protein [Bryobacteraceae bacterium]
MYLLVLLVLISFTPVRAQSADDGRKQYAALCAGCHGDSAGGTDRGPALINSRSLRRRSAGQIAALVRGGTPGGMPAFPIPDAQLRPLASLIRSWNASALEVKPEGDAAAGRAFFQGEGKCAGCHMVRGVGGTNGPDLSDAGRQLTIREIEQILDDPTAQIGARSTASCPGWAFCPQEPWVVVNVRMKNGSTMRGFARSQGRHDLQLQTFDGKIHLLADSEYQSISREKQSYMPPLRASASQRRDVIAYVASLDGVPVGPSPAAVGAPSAADMQHLRNPAPGEWPSYNGKFDANRHSSLDQINLANVGKLRLAWSYSLPYFGLEATPLVSHGVMYMSGPNQVCAIDARSGREIWCYLRTRSSADEVAGDAAKGATRGVALLGDRVFFATDNAHLICLNRITGALMWDVNMPSSPGQFGATAAPLVVDDLVISGIAGGDGPLRGFLAAYKVTTGEQVWRFWTIPARGEKGSETWGPGPAIETGGGATWLTGSYDPETGLLYWPTGNPFPDTDGDPRPGDNLYTNCVVALDVKTGKLRWHFQFTPHDLHDWDATEPLVLVNAPFQGRQRKLLLQANRSGFFYVLDRTTGEFLLGKPFVKRLTWASGIGADGRPQLVPSAKPTPAGVRACPAVRGATNWYSTAYNPAAKLFYVMAVEDCNLYKQAGLGGYVPLRDPANPPEKYLRALDIETGKVVWEVPQVGAPEANYSGVLSTAGGLVFYGETGGGFAAVDAKSGKTLWHFETGQQWKASPMTYTVNGKQYVAIAAGSNVLAFALPD